MLVTRNKEFYLTIRASVIIKGVYELKPGEVVIKKNKDDYDILYVESIENYEKRGIVTVKFCHNIVKIYGQHQMVFVIQDFNNMMNGALK